MSEQDQGKDRPPQHRVLFTNLRDDPTTLKVYLADTLPVDPEGLRLTGMDVAASLINQPGNERLILLAQVLLGDSTCKAIELQNRRLPEEDMEWGIITLFPAPGRGIVTILDALVRALAWTERQETLERQALLDEFQRAFQEFLYPPSTPRPRPSSE